MLTRGATFLARLERSHDKIVEVSQPFLTAASKVLVHGKSRVVAGALITACKSRDIEVNISVQLVSFDNFHDQVVLTKSSGEMAKKLQAENIHVKVVDDLAVGVEMHRVDCVLLGAEGVVETGGGSNI